MGSDLFHLDYIPFIHDILGFLFLKKTEKYQNFYFARLFFGFFLFFPFSSQTKRWMFGQ
jgi:hypothetical protein